MYHVIWQSAIDVFRFFDPSPPSKQRRPSVTTSVSPGQSALYSVYVSPNTPASALQSLFDVLVRDIYDITSGARVCAGGSSCMILLDFRATKQGFERCDMQRHTSSTEPIGLILAHTPPWMSLGRGVPSIPCIHAGVSKKP